MKKKIIEKLEIPDTNAVIGLADRDGKEIEIKAIGRKVNEIIDVLNSWVFEPTLTIPSQSQKQPEENYKCGTLEVLKNRKLRKKLENQEEWKDELRDIIKKSYFNLGRTGHSGVVNMLEDFISQLLSERTFSKEELRLLNAYLSLALPEYNNFDKETKMHEDMDKLHKILEKTSKLLKDKE